MTPRGVWRHDATDVAGQCEDAMENAERAGDGGAVCSGAVWSQRAVVGSGGGAGECGDAEGSGASAVRG
jgi:hypothetical protein